MRNQLTELTNRIDSYNAEFTEWMKQALHLLHKRGEVIAAGRHLLTKKQMGSMLLNANVTFSGEARRLLNEALPEDHLEEFTDNQRDPTNPMTNGNPGGTNPSAPDGNLSSINMKS